MLGRTSVDKRSPLFEHAHAYSAPHGLATLIPGSSFNALPNLPGFGSGF